MLNSFSVLRTLRRTCALTSLFWLACAPKPHVTNPPTSHAVWWSPALQLASAAQIPQALERPFEAPFEVQGPDGAKGFIATCADYQRLRPLGYAPLDQPSFGALQQQGALCDALRILARARPSRDAALLELLASADLLARLPVRMLTASSDDEIKRRDAAQAAGQTWLAYDPTWRVLSRAEHRAELGGAQGKTRLELYVAGDFDGDGAQDALIKGLSFGDEGTWFEMRLWWVTPAPEGRLRVVEEFPL